jgi:putative two-component system response regulator
VEQAIKSKLQRMASEMAQRSMSGEASREFYRKSLEWLIRIKSLNHLPVRLQCLQNCAKHFYLMADIQFMMKAVSAFELLALKSGEKTWIRKALSFRGVAHADAGDFYQALICLGDALRTARELGSVFDEAVILVNLGYTLRIAGLYTDAIRVSERAIHLGMSDVSMSKLGSNAAINIASILFHQGKHDLGIRYIQRSLEMEVDFAPDQYNQHRVTLEENYVQLAIGLGDTALADQRLALCEEFARKADTPRARHVTALARALCQIDHGDARAGVQLLRSLLLSGGLVSDDWVDCNIFLIRGYEKLGEVDEALRCVDALSSGLTKAYRSSFEALAQENSFQATLRSDQLDALANERSRLKVLAAERWGAQAKREAIERLAMTAQLKDDSTGLHGHRVGCLSRLFAEHLRLRQEVMEQVEVAGRLHDIGKMAIPDQVLRSGTAPSPAERELLNAHARIGADLLAQSAIPEIQCAEIVARHHHERWDGEGYPSKMKGKRIPVECRIVAIVDCFDAMTHGRPHVRPVAASVALGEIQVQKGKQFDPELADAFVGFMQQLLADHPDVSRFLEQSSRKSPLTDAMRELDDLLAAVSEEKHERPAVGHPPPSARPRPAPSTRSPEPL